MSFFDMLFLPQCFPNLYVCYSPKHATLCSCFWKAYALDFCICLHFTDYLYGDVLNIKTIKSHVLCVQCLFFFVFQSKLGNDEK